MDQGYKQELINKHIKTVEKMDRKELSRERDNTTSKETIPLVLTNNLSLPDIGTVACKLWKHFIYKQIIQQNFSKCSSYLFQTKQKFEGANLYQQNGAQQGEKTCQHHEKRKILPLFGK